MKRLTKRGARKNGYVSSIGSGSGCWGQIIDRLAAYEDTEMEPEEVADLKKAWDMYGGEEGITALLTPPPTAPLTLEELREMDGEPVWNDTMKKWVIVDLFWEHGPRTVDARGGWRDLDDRYYRRKPEEGMQHG